MVDFTPKKGNEKAKGGMGERPKGAEVEAPPTIYLQHHHLEKLGLKEMPAVGSKIKISGLAHVGSTSENQDREMGGGKRRSMTLHLHKMEMGTDEKGHEENQKAGMKAAVDKALTKGAGSESEGDAENEKD